MGFSLFTVSRQQFQNMTGPKFSKQHCVQSGCVMQAVISSFTHYCGCLQRGDNVNEANAWMLQFLDEPACIHAVLAVMSTDISSTSPEVFFSAKLLQALLRKENWIQDNLDNIKSMQQVILQRQTIFLIYSFTFVVLIICRPF